MIWFTALNMNFKEWFNFNYTGYKVSSEFKLLMEEAYNAGKYDTLCHNCRGISGVYLQICDRCMTEFNSLQETNTER